MSLGRIATVTLGVPHLVKFGKFLTSRFLAPGGFGCESGIGAQSQHKAKRFANMILTPRMAVNQRQARLLFFRPVRLSDEDEANTRWQSNELISRI